MSLHKFSLTKPVVLSHPALFEAKAFQKNGKDSGEPRFGCSLSFDPDSPDFKAIKAIAVTAAKAKWAGRDIAGEYKAGTFKMPWTPGDALADRRAKKLATAGKEDDGSGDFQRGKMILKTSSKYQPVLSVISPTNRLETLDLTTEALILLYRKQFYFGVEVLADLKLQGYEGVGANPDGVSVYVNMVLSTNRGEKLSRGASTAEVFKGYLGQASAEDPTAGETLDDL